MLPKLSPFRLAGVAAMAIALPFLTTQAQEGAKAPPALGPVESFEYWRDAAAEGRLGDVFRSCPESYQKDVNGLITKFATKMDQDLWDGVVAMLGSVSNILNNQKEIVIGSETFDQLDPEAKNGFTENWDEAAELFAAFTKSDVLDLAQWKKGDAAGLLDGPGAEFFKGLSAMEIPDQGGATFGELVGKIKDAKAELVSEDGDTAVVKTTDPDGKVTDATMMRVEGRWVPSEMASDWESMMAEANSSLDEMDFESPEFAEQKMMVMMGLGAGKQLLKQLEEAKTSEDFDRTVQSIAKMVGSFGG